jgi:NUMOD4 motif
MPEDWKPIAGDKGFYEVSPHGWVRSYHHSELGEIIRLYLASGSKRYVGHILRRRYLVIDLCNGQSTSNPIIGGRRRGRQFAIHRLVAQACLVNDGSTTNPMPDTKNNVRGRRVRALLREAGLSTGPVCYICPTCGWFFLGGTVGRLSSGLVQIDRLSIA